MIALAATYGVTAYAKEPQLKYQRDVRNYVIEMANKYNVPTSRALFIAEHESQFVWRNHHFEPTLEGDDGRSIGLWQINLGAHPEVSYKCATSISCSTEWAMPHLLKEPNIWSAWRFRKLWYKDK